MSESQELTKLSKQIQRWGKGTLQNQDAELLAKITHAYGLDPFMGHIEVLGNKLYVTVGGLIHHAQSSGKLDGIETSLIVGQERKEIIESLSMPDDTVIYYARVYRQDQSHPYTAYGFASDSDVNLSGKKRKDIQAMAENRSMGRALRKAFSVAFTAYDELDPDQVEIVREENTTKPDIDIKAQIESKLSDPGVSTKSSASTATTTSAQDPPSQDADGGGSPPYEELTEEQRDAVDTYRNVSGCNEENAIGLLMNYKGDAKKLLAHASRTADKIADDESSEPPPPDDADAPIGLDNKVRVTGN